MSEYIEVSASSTEDPAIMLIETNLHLAEGELEEYQSTHEMEEGSALAQFIAPIDGVVHLQIEANNLTVRRDLEVPWHFIISDIKAALKEFFL